MFNLIGKLQGCFPFLFYCRLGKTGPHYGPKWLCNRSFHTIVKLAYPDALPRSLLPFLNTLKRHIQSLCSPSPSFYPSLPLSLSPPFSVSFFHIRLLTTKWSESVKIFNVDSLHVVTSQKLPQPALEG